ncbi:1-aminocyclopropane-1-carboxylate deaminase/D-cysteine desulfhydrase [Marinomonas sp. IMCC 4694]|uniref:1-aminocyclopropane-1-carboxylate deaminase/D-cysteine desulfhydrase n=1 Tax=Marinomonas sp. IMCC 4694 TaxID=2605432 RepID=UPI0011E72BB5|nr:pyridoxal-phosphate dependent enzyme [Marinomonas sp. IMCC 4694]TYL47777.1 pyridoxal-phosphate dependent enzyme [Marinomonas sp. IMCC 4694]
MSLFQSLVLPAPCQSRDRPYELTLYRGDLEHPRAPGNKWHKLQYHLQAASQQEARVIATWGGPFSNHLHAFAATLCTQPFSAVAVVRGELQPKLTPTLHDLVDQNVELWPSSRADYRLGEEAEVVQKINAMYRSVYWIPEGGGGRLGAQGCQDWAQQIHQQNPHFDAWVVSSGTGTTAAGLLAYEQAPDLQVFSALKGEPSQRNAILTVAQLLTPSPLKTLSDKLFFHHTAHQGGYAKHSEALRHFMIDFAKINPNATLDPVYTCKSMFAVMSAMRAGTWPYRRTLFIHTGGLQGWRGFSKSDNPFEGST